MKQKSDDAVSPVIATILLVAIVVVLVAVIAATVLPMAGNIESMKSVSVTVSANGANTHPIVTIIGGKDATTLTNLMVYVSNTTDAVLSQSSPIVGKPYSAEAPDKDGLQTVSVVGTFSDGTNQTLYTGSMVFSKAT